MDKEKRYNGIRVEMLPLDHFHAAYVYYDHATERWLENEKSENRKDMLMWEKQCKMYAPWAIVELLERIAIALETNRERTIVE